MYDCFLKFKSIYISKAHVTSFVFVQKNYSLGFLWNFGIVLRCPISYRQFRDKNVNMQSCRFSVSFKFALFVLLFCFWKWSWIISRCLLESIPCYYWNKVLRCVVFIPNRVSYSYLYLWSCNLTHSFFEVFRTDFA